MEIPKRRVRRFAIGTVLGPSPGTSAGSLCNGSREMVRIRTQICTVSLNSVALIKNSSWSVNNNRKKNLIYSLVPFFSSESVHPKNLFPGHLIKVLLLLIN